MSSNMQVNNVLVNKMILNKLCIFITDDRSLELDVLTFDWKVGSSLSETIVVVQLQFCVAVQMPCLRGGHQDMSSNAIRGGCVFIGGVIYWCCTSTMNSGIVCIQSWLLCCCNRCVFRHCIWTIVPLFGLSNFCTRIKQYASLWNWWDTIPTYVRFVSTIAYNFLKVISG